ncbi:MULTISPECIES: methyltransferase family protein [unclassified Paraflavitalea]|uniref:methyltransferase family protein n=1 Tax=unclassified Paraflavitalea TaxID=2798305 RepID=UPI003D33425F
MRLQNQMVSDGNILFKHRGWLPVLILIPALAVKYFSDQKFIDTSGSENEWYHYLCYAVSIFGLVIRFVTVARADKNTSGRNISAGQVADSLNTTGIYSICRHPLYIGNFFMWLGVGMLTYHLWFIVSFVLFYIVYYERIILAEEAYLASKFQPAYDEWTEKTPAILPSFGKWKPFSNCMNLWKGLKQEKTGIMLLNIVFLLFISVETQNFNWNWEENMIWMILFGAGIAYYVIVKGIEKATKTA